MNTTYFQTTGLSVLSLAAVGCGEQHPGIESSERPNIVLFLADDIGAECFGCMGGVGGLLNRNFRRLDSLAQEKLERLKYTPGTVIGSSRYPLAADDYARLADVLQEEGFGYVLMSGGNGTMDTCGRLHRACAPKGILAGGVPKTIDNDISVTDHSPGFGSAARYIAGAVRAIGEDVKSLPIHVCIVEAMGRNAGWIAAASALARKDSSDAPHLIYLPERPFDEEAFLREVKALHERQGGVVVVVSEGLKNRDGQPIVPPLFQTGRAVYYGDVSAYLAELVIRRLGVKARSEKPGLLGRAQTEMQSFVDRNEAVEAGAEAVRVLLDGQSGFMTGFKRVSTEPYRVRLIRIPLEDVTLAERTLPPEYIAPSGHDVTNAFLSWARPLLGDDFPEYFSW